MTDAEFNAKIIEYLRGMAVCLKRDGIALNVHSLQYLAAVCKEAADITEAECDA